MTTLTITVSPGHGEIVEDDSIVIRIFIAYLNFCFGGKKNLTLAQKNEMNYNVSSGTLNPTIPYCMGKGED